MNDMTRICVAGVGLLASTRKAEASLPEEERNRRREERRLEQEERHRRACIVQGICPSCREKLIRGKKNRKNDYKRDWYCSGCESTHSL